MELLKRKSLEIYEWFSRLVSTKAKHYTELTGDCTGDISFKPGTLPPIQEYERDSSYRALMAQQQQAVQHQHNQLRAQQMGAATAGMGALLGQLHARPQPPTPAPFPPPVPVEEPKPEEVPVEEPEFEEVTKEDGTTVLRLKK